MRKILLVLLMFVGNASSNDLDFKLEKVIEVYGLKGFDCKAVQPFDRRLSDLGDELFNSKLLSGGQDTSCSTCHIKELNRVDGLPISVGVGGKGEGIERLIEGKGILVPRNVFTFIGRGHKNYDTYFWDGRVQALNDETISVIGKEGTKGFNSPLAVASILPILARDEFLGLLEEQDENKMMDLDERYYEDRYLFGSDYLKTKIANSEGKNWEALREHFNSAGIDPKNVALSDIGNAIASFIIVEENCIKNGWTKYIEGDKKALTNAQKRGAFLFYGKGRCASCHSGDLLSDFDFHSIATPQGEFGFSIDGQDLGRSEVTLKTGDRFKFKTPSLLGVAKTKPYGHNGTFNTLDEVVLFHLNPIPYFKDKELSKKEFFNYGRVLSSRSEVLSYIDIFTEEEFRELVNFLDAL